MDSSAIKHIQSFTSQKFPYSKKINTISLENSASKNFQPYRKESPYKTVTLRTTENFRKLHRETFPYQDHATNTNYRSMKVSAREPATNFSTDSSQEVEIITEEEARNRKMRSYKPSPSVSTHYRGPSKYHSDIVSTAFKTPINKDFVQNNGSELQSRETKGNLSSILRTTQEKNKRAHLEEDLEQNERSMRIVGFTEENTTAKKKYSLFEDWRILETVEHYIHEIGLSGIFSKNTWEKMKDPRTKCLLLNGDRTGESMRTRYRKFLTSMTEKDKEELRKFAREHSEQQMKQYSCLFSKETEPKPALQSNTLNVPQSAQTKKALSFNSIKERSIDRFGAGTSELLTPHFEAIFESENSIEDSRRDRMMQQNPVFRRKGSESSEVDNSREVRRTSAGKYSNTAEPRTSQNSKQPAWKYPKEESGRKRMLNVSAYEEDLEEDSRTFTPFDRKKVKREKEIYRGQNHFDQVQERSFTFNNRGFEQLQGNTEEEESKEQQNDISRETGPIMLDTILEDILESQQLDLENVNKDIMICVDYDKSTREFIFKEEEKTPQNRLMKIAKEFGLDLGQALKLYHASSDDYEDLMNYLRSGDKDLLWEPIDDKGLIFNDSTALYYLERIKGPENVQKRMKYLMGRGEGMQKELAQALAEDCSEEDI